MGRASAPYEHQLTDLMSRGSFLHERLPLVFVGLESAGFGVERTWRRHRSKPLRQRRSRPANAPARGRPFPPINRGWQLIQSRCQYCCVRSCSTSPAWGLGTSSKEEDVVLARINHERIGPRRERQPMFCLPPRARIASVEHERDRSLRERSADARAIVARSLVTR
jgi:hypothetical protein